MAREAALARTDAEMMIPPLTASNTSTADATPSSPTTHNAPASMQPSPPVISRSSSRSSLIPSFHRRCCSSLALLFLLIVSLDTSIVDVSVLVEASLSEPTLVGVERCHSLPNVRLPLYWSGEYSPDGTAHLGPVNVTSTVLGIGGGHGDDDEDDRRGERTRRDVRGRRKTKVISTPSHMGVPSSTDGTVRANVEDVAVGSPVIVVLMAYADHGESGELASTLEDVIREVNVEYLADALHPEHEADPTKSPPPVAGVVINAALPLQCDERSVLQGSGVEEDDDDTRNNKAERCASEHPEWLRYDNWQGKLIEKAPRLPVLQDTTWANAFDDSFGGYYDDFVIYMDGVVYEYLPSDLALMHSDWLRMEYHGGDGPDGEGGGTKKRKKEDDKGGDLRARLKEATMGALNHVGDWCGEEGGGGEDGGAPSAPSSLFGWRGQSSSPSPRSSSSSSSSSSVPWYDRTFLASYVDDTESIAYDVALGFVFAAFSTAIVVLLCVAQRFFTSKCCPPDSRRRMKHGHHDGLGMFQVLSQHDDDYDEHRALAAAGDYWSESDDDDDLVRNEYGMSGVEDDDEAVHRFEVNRAAREFSRQCGDDSDEEEVVFESSEFADADDEKDDDSDTKKGTRGGGGGGGDTEEVTSTSSRSGRSRASRGSSGGSSSRAGRRLRPGDRPPPPPTMDLEMIERRIVQSMQPHPPPMPPKDLLS